MGKFGWLGTERIPAALDLRDAGWELVAPPEDLAAASFPLLLAGVMRAVAIRPLRARARVLVADIPDSVTRAHLLALGFGDAVGPALSGEELALRASRLARTLTELPRRRTHGAVVLDLLHREGWVGRHRLGLHPREFALLWRLAETPGEAVSPGTLLSEVWQLTHRPETNSLAVHVCRLRAKLAVAGLPDLLHTAPTGYMLEPPAHAVTELPFARSGEAEADACRTEA
jgi:DNA-binding response OmpR family regulator